MLERLPRPRLDLQRRFLRIIAVGLGAHETLFDDLLVDGPHLTRAIHYPAMATAPGGPPRLGRRARRHLPDDRAAPGDRRRPPGAHAPTAGSTPSRPTARSIINTGIMLERITNGMIPRRLHRVVAAPDAGRRPLLGRAVLPPDPVDDPRPAAAVHRRRAPAALTRAIEAGDRLDQVLYEINLVEDARRVWAPPRRFGSSVRPVSAGLTQVAAVRPIWVVDAARARRTDPNCGCCGVSPRGR